MFIVKAGLVVLVVLPNSPTWERRNDALPGRFRVIARMIDFFTTVELSAVPSENVIPDRSGYVHVFRSGLTRPLATVGIVEAMPGKRVVLVGLYTNNVSKI